MTELFEYDVFLSYSSKDRPLVRELAERLRRDGLHVWFDEWEIRPGDLISLKIEQGLERSRTLVLAVSESALASDWVRLERHTALFRDPTNAQRRFIPLRLDNSKFGDVLKQFFYIDWQDRSDEQYVRLLKACRSSFETKPATPPSESKHLWRTPKSVALALILVFGIGVLTLYLKIKEKETKAADASINVESSPLAETANSEGPAPPLLSARSDQKQPATDPSPSKKPARKRTTEKPSPTAEPSPSPEEVPKAQAASEPAPAASSIPETTPVEEKRPTSLGSVGVSQFKEMEELFVGIESFSEKAMEAHEEVVGVNNSDELYNRLEDFNAAALNAKREFRKATGTGLRGTFNKLRGQSGDSRALEIKVQDLARRADEIDRLIGSSSSATQNYWKEVRGRLERLQKWLQEKQPLPTRPPDTASPPPQPPHPLSPSPHSPGLRKEAHPSTGA